MNYKIEEKAAKIATGAAEAAKVINAVTKSGAPYETKKGRVYNDIDIQGILSEGYFIVARSLWDHLQIGSHVRYFKKDEDKPRAERFKPGGFIRSLYVSNNKKMIKLETIRGGSKARDPSYISFTLCYDNIDEIWKKYDSSVFIEMHLIHNSLAQLSAEVISLKTQLKLIKDKQNP